MASEVAKKASTVGNVHYHPFLKTVREPFGLYIEDNSVFKKYDNIPLTVFQLTQKVISTAANNFDTPVWFTFCINESGQYLPFCSTVTGLPDHFEVPVILNGKLLRNGKKPKPHTRVWPALIRLPYEDRHIKEQAFICYERGSVISAADVYGF